MHLVARDAMINWDSPNRRKMKSIFLFFGFVLTLNIYCQMNSCFDIRYLKISRFADEILSDSIEREFTDSWKVLRKRGKINLIHSKDHFLFPNIDFINIGTQKRKIVESILNDSINQRIIDVKKKEKFLVKDGKYVEGYTFYDLDRPFFPYIEKNNFFFFDTIFPKVFNDTDYSGKCALISYSRIIENICGIMVIPLFMKDLPFSFNLTQVKPMIYIFYFDENENICKVDKIEIDVYYSFVGKHLINDYKILKIW